MPDLYPLSHPQQRIFLVQQLHPGTPVWNVPYGVRMAGPLDEEALEQAVDLTVAEFDALRLQFTEQEGEVHQYLVEAGQGYLELVQLADENQLGYEAWARSFVTEPIWALDTPLFCFVAARIGESSWGLILKAHHIIMDGRGALNVVNRLLEHYLELQQGVTPTALVKRASYLDFLGYEQQYLDSPQARQDRDCWLQQFSSIPEALELFPETGGGSVASNRYACTAPPELAQQVEAFCEQRRISPFRLVLAILYLYLARTTRTRDLVIGTAFMNRDYPGMADIAGMFVSTVPIRLEVAEDATLHSMLQQLKTALDRLRDHQQYPFDLLINDLRERDGQTQQLIQITIAQVMRSDLPGGARLEYLCRRSHADPLTLYVSHGRPGEQGVPLELFFDYQTAVFSEERVRALAGHLLNLLKDALEQPDLLFSRLRLLGEEEQRRLLKEFNATETVFPEGTTLHALFEEQVQRTPDKAALVFRDQQISYAELNARANALAQLLRKNGAQPDTIVGLLVDRSPEMIIGALGILKSGAGYAPIDPQYPDDRISYMLENSQARLLVTQGQYLDRMAGDFKVINLDDRAALTESGGNPAPLSGPEQIACLIYTSGSTGNPKGVMLEHCALVNFVHCMLRDRGLTADDKVAKHASFSFDVSIFEIYPTLACGATLYIVPDEIRLNLVPLNDYYEQQGITRAFFTTQLGEQFIELFDNRSLKTLDVGGEKLRFFRKRRYQLYNCYGPTEASVYCTQFPVEREYANIPIGRPLANYRIHILDQYDNLLPVGAPGELCIAGVALARGYWNLPDKTAAAFVSDPFEPGGRLYRTGDLARWLPDGTLEHLGRIDRQLKIRGFRIEPGEIEAAILRLDGVQQCAVLDIKEPSGRVALCAYLVVDRSLDSAQLREELGMTLPEYMLPQYVLQLDSLPLTGSGKIDRKALPRPEAVACEVAVYTAPRSDLEKRMAELWQEVLKLPKVGIDDNFFTIGGQSLKAAFLLARMQKQLGLRVEMQGFFKTPTIRQLCDQAGGATPIEPVAVMPQLLPAPAAQRYPLTPSQTQLFVLSRMAGIGISYNVPLRLTITGPLDTARLSWALQQLVDRHESLRTAFVLGDDGLPCQEVRQELRLERRYQEADEEEIAALARQFVRPFDLSRPPLFRAQLLQSGPDRFHLLLDLHHSVCDGVSQGILLRELNILYNGGTLPPAQLQYKDYAVWLEQQRQTAAVLEQGRFWHERFSEPQPCELPLDHPRPAGACFSGTDYRWVLERDLYRDLTGLATTCGYTLHSVLFAGLHLLLSRYCRQEDIITGTSMAGRLLDEVRDMVGMFVATVPVRSFPKPAISFRELVAEVGQTMLLTHQNLAYPLERLYESLGLRRGAGRHPLFDVNFVLQNMEQELLTADGLVCERYPIPTGTCKFDLSFAASEGNGTLAFRLDYRSDLFEAATIQRMTAQFMTLLETVCRHPDRPMQELELIAPDERRTLLQQFNPASRPLPAWQTVVAAFQRHAAERPGAAALVAEDGRLSYAELQCRSDRLAWQLKKQGVGEDQVVAIMADRSLQVVVAMLAVLKAGGAYTAVDPHYPAERIRLILENAEPCLLLGTASALAGVAAELPRIVLDQPVSEQEEGAPVALPEPSPASLAYLIYTSGSTGRPKGVMVEHRNLVNFLGWYTRLHGFTPDDHCAAFASFSFDASVAQVWAPLVSGSCLHIIPESLRLAPEELNRYFEAERICHAHFPTQFAEQFMALTDNRSLKRMVVGGDALRSWKSSGFRLVNEYGPSETTVASTAQVVDQPFERVPIGSPADNTRVYVLDSTLHLQPIGAPGEICIAGAGVARGYRNNPEQTAERFVADPFVAGARMYRTGDLGRWLADGTLEFLGRVDFQVKIRGFRIEPAEIEQSLLTLPGISRALVLARTDEAGNRYLCAYYEAAAELPQPELKQQLAALLPEYMIPQTFVRLEAFPINRNGKIDRAALPDPVFNTQERVLPRNETEQQIMVAWQKVLPQWQGGVLDSFFESGGDSLKAIALTAELQKQFEVRVGDIFSYPTIAQQAANLKAVQDNLKKRLLHLQESLQEAARRAAALADNTAWQAVIAQYHGMMAADQQLDLNRQRQYRHLLLTGATGYLGVYLLRELMLHSDCRVTALVRGSTDVEAQQRLHDKLVWYFGSGIPTDWEQRLEVLAADLTQERAGLPEPQWQRLGEQVDAILHSAANVRHYGRYEEFYASNTLSTKHLLELATIGTRADFHYISTTSTGQGVTDAPFALYTEYDLEIGQKPGNIYVQTKLEAERLVVAARSQGLNCCIYRVGNICFDSHTGRFQDNIEENGFFQQVRCYGLLGAAPDQGDERNLTFVDQCAAAVVRLLERPALLNQTFHLSNPHRVALSSFLQGEGLGLNIQVLGLSRFISLLADRFDLPLFNDAVERLMLHQGWLDRDPTQVAVPLVIRTERTDQLLARAGFSWSTPEPAAMRQMVLQGLGERLQFLRTVPVFGLMTEPELEELALAGRPVWYGAGEQVLSEGESGEQLFALVSGHLELSRLSRDGWSGTIRVVGPGELLGKDRLLHQLPSPVTAEVLFEGAVLLSFDAARFEKMLAASPRLALGLAKLLSQTVNRLESLFVNLA